ncbi:MAG TPA: DUF5666 domain-containing protein [Bryobacteraceae bacterium]|nr:DUF5666 domain-containing protein [Bryobacteraceae bacterium]
MKQNRTFTKLALSFALCAVLVLAHGGLEHVIGTIAKISSASVTVTTTDQKTVEVLLDAKTTYSRGSQAIQRTDLKVGDRVVIHAEKSGEKLTAHTVEIGTATKATQH